MTKTAIAFAAAIIALAGCTSPVGQQALSADTPQADTPQADTPQADTPQASTDTPRPGARSIPVDPAWPVWEPLPGPGIYNSDNRPIITRSGLNSDPDNPSGMPGRPY